MLDPRGFHKTVPVLEFMGLSPLTGVAKLYQYKKLMEGMIAKTLAVPKELLGDMRSTDAMGNISERLFAVSMGCSVGKR